MQTCYFELINPAVFVLKNVNYYSEYSLANSPLLYWYWNKNRVLVKTNTILTAHFCFLPLILFNSSSFIEYLFEYKYIIYPLEFHPCCKCYTSVPFCPLCPLDNYTAQRLGIIWRRLGQSNGSFQNYLFVQTSSCQGSGVFWPNFIQQPIIRWCLPNLN